MISQSKRTYNTNHEFREKYKVLVDYTAKLERMIQLHYPEISVRDLRENIDSIERKMVLAEDKPRISIKEHANGRDESTGPNSTDGLANEFISSTSDQSFFEYLNRQGLIAESGKAPLNKKSQDLMSESHKDPISKSLVIDTLRILPYDCYVLNYVDVFFNIIETNSFYIQERNFRAQINKLLELRKINDVAALIAHWRTLILLLAVMALCSGYEYLNQGVPLENYKNLMIKPGYRYFEACLPFIGPMVNEKAYQSIQCLLLLGLFLLTYNHGNNTMTDSGYIYVYIATEIAIINNFHKREIMQHEDEESYEFYKRLWWTCYTTEKRIGISMGKPELITIGQITTELPEEVTSLCKSRCMTSHLNQRAFVELIFIFCKISSTIFKKAVRLDSSIDENINYKVIRGLLKDLEEWKSKLPDVCCFETTHYSHGMYRANSHLYMCHHLAKIYVCKPFFLYKLDLLRKGNTFSEHETILVDYLVSICIDSSYRIMETLDVLTKNNKVAICSIADLNFCTIALFVTIAYFEIDKSNFNRYFLRIGLNILKLLSNGTLSGQLLYNKLKPAESLLQDFPESKNLQEMTLNADFDYSKDIHNRSRLSDGLDNWQNDMNNVQFPLDLLNEFAFNDWNAEKGSRDWEPFFI